MSKGWVEGAALVALVGLAAFSAGCLGANCEHGSWGPKHGWKCHDQNDERGPEREWPPRGSRFGGGG